MRHHIWTEGIYVNLLDFLHPFALLEIFPLTENGDGRQKAEFRVVHLHFDHAPTEAEKGLGPKAGLFVVFFREGMVVGENDRLSLGIIPENEIKEDLVTAVLVAF